MQDLTTGPISTHLLKTASFMLVTMVFQTLYFLVDLYWVGHLGKEAVAGVGVAGNLTFIVLAVSQMLGVGTTTLVSHAAGQRNAERALLVFNQSQVLSTVVGLVFLTVSMAFRTAYANGLSADATTAGSAADYLLYFLPAMSLQFGMVGMAAALRGVGNFKPGMVVQTATVIINIVLAPVLMFGWGTGRPMGVAGAAVASLIAVAIGVAWLVDLLLRPRKLSALRRARHEAAVPALEGHAEDRTAGRRRVRDDGRLPDAGLRVGPAVRCRRASRLRHRHARGAGAVHAGRGARVLGGAGGRSERGRPARRSGQGGLQGRQPDGGGMDAAHGGVLQHRARRAHPGSSRTTRPSSPSARSTCASSRGRSSRRG